MAACLTVLEHKYVTATDGDGSLKFESVVSEQARAKLPAPRNHGTAPCHSCTRTGRPPVPSTSIRPLRNKAIHAPKP